MPSFVYILIGALFFMAVMRFSIWQMQKLSKFLLVGKDSDMEKHSPKILLHSLLKYLAVLFVMIFCTTLGMLVYPMIIVWCINAYIIFRYIKLWKYHDKSLLLLFGLSAATAAAAILASPYIREAFGIIAGFINNI